MNEEPLGFIRRTDETRDMDLSQLTIAYLNAQLKEKNAEIERLRTDLVEISKLLRSAQIIARIDA